VSGFSDLALEVDTCS